MLIRLILIIASLVGPAWAQYGNPLIQGWDGQNRMWTQAKGGGDLVWESQDGKGPRKFRIPFGGAIPSIVGNRCIAFVPSKGETGGGLLHRWIKGSRWETLATIPAGIHLSKIHPLGEDRYLLIAGKDLFVLGDAASSYAIGAIGPDGILKLERLVEVPLKGGLYQKTPPSSVPPEGMEPKEATRRFRLIPEYRVFNSQHRFSPETFFPYPGGGGVLVYHYPGYLFVLDEKGEIRKSIRIYPDFDEARLKKLLHQDAVLLGVAWTESGKLLLAVREKAGVFESHKLYPLFSKDGKTPLPPEESYPNQEKRLAAFPKIDWMELDMEEGKLRTLEYPPMGAPMELFGKIQPTYFSFLARKDGGIEMKSGD